MTTMTAAVDPSIRPLARLKTKPQRGAIGRLKRDLAEARAELARLDQAEAARRRHEATVARDSRYRQAVDQLDRDHRRWRRAPDLFRDALGATWQGALVLARIWSALVDAMQPGSLDLTLELVCQAMMANGSPWKVQQATPEGWWIMARYLAEQHENQEKMALWIKKSRDLEPLLQQQRAQMQVMEAMIAGDPAEELRARAAQQAAHWAAEAERLRAIFEAEAAHAAQTLAGTGLGDRTMTQQARLLLAQRKAARDYCQKLEKRLDSLRKNRQRPATSEKSTPTTINQQKRSEPTASDRSQFMPQPAPSSPLTSQEQAMLANIHEEIHRPVEVEELTTAIRQLTKPGPQNRLLIRA